MEENEPSYGWGKVAEDFFCGDRRDLQGQVYEFGESGINLRSSSLPLAVAAEPFVGLRIR